MRLIFSIAIFLVTFSPFDPVNGNPDRVEEYRKMDFKERASPGDHGLNNGIRAHIIKASECEWGEWSEWSECSKSCAVGRQERKQKLMPPPKTYSEEQIDDFECEGAKMHHRHCNQHHCDEDGGGIEPNYTPYPVPGDNGYKTGYNGYKTPGYSDEGIESSTQGYSAEMEDKTEDAYEPTRESYTTMDDPSYTSESTTPTPSYYSPTTEGPSDMPPLVRCESKRDCKGQERLDVYPSRPMKHCDMGSKKASSYDNKKGICSDRNKCDTDEDCIKFGGEAVMVCKKMRSRKSGYKSKVCRWTGEIDKQPEPSSVEVEQSAETGEPQNTLVLCKHKRDCYNAQRCQPANGYGEYDNDNDCVAMNHCDKGPKKLYKEEGVCTDKQKCRQDSDCAEIGNPTDGIAGMKCKKMRSKQGKISRLCRWTGEIDVEEEELSQTLPLIKCKHRRECEYKCEKNDDCEGLIHCDKNVCNDRQECKTDDDCGDIGDSQTTGAAERYCIGAGKSPYSRCMVRSSPY